MDIAIIGVGLHPFGRHNGKSGLDLGEHAIRDALNDAGIAWDQIDASYGGGLEEQANDGLLPRLGLTGSPFTNVFNGCATGGSALTSAVHSVEAGASDVALAFGLDKHPRGMFNPSAAELGLQDWYGDMGFIVTVQFFAMKTRRYMHDHGISEDSLVRIAEKNFANGSITPHAWRTTAMSPEQIRESRMICSPLTQYMLCTPCEGAAAVIVCRASEAHKYTSKPVFLRGLSIKTRSYGSLEVFQPANPLAEATTPVEAASKAAYEMAGLGPEDVQVAQLQDSESGHEIMHMAETGLCEHGEQEYMLQNGQTHINGRLPVNTDGGLIANGEPVGASGLRQVYEVCKQLRGEAGERQVPNNPQTGLTQVYGAPGLSAVAIMQR